MELSNLNIKNGLCISLGANIDSKFGSPIETFLKCRPVIENIIKDWQTDFHSKEIQSSTNIFFDWSSIYVTNPHGTSFPQPDYLNSLLLVKSISLLKPSSQKAKYLLKKFKFLEEEYGRNISKNKIITVKFLGYFLFKSQGYMLSFFIATFSKFICKLMPIEFLSIGKFNLYQSIL